MNGLDKKLVSNATFLFLDWLFITFLGFVYWSINGKTLLPEQYGIVSTSINLATFLSGLGLLGFNITLWKLLPEYLERKQKNRARELTTFSLKMVFVTNIVLILILIFSSNIIAEILKIPTNVVFITSINILIVSLWMQFAAILIGTQKMKKIAVTDLIGQVIKVFTSIALIFLGFSYFGPLLGYILGVFVVVLLRIPFMFLGKVKKKVLNKKQILFDFALPAFIANFALLVFINGQYVLLSAIKSPEVTGIFSIALLLTSPIVSVPNTLSSALFPIISRLSINHNSKGNQRYLINMVFRYALLFSVPITIFLILFSNQIILVFARSEYLPASDLFPILGFASIIYGVGIIFNQSIYSLGKPKIQRNIILITVTLFFILAIPLTIVFSALGMGLAYLLSVSLFNFVSYRITKKILKIKLPFDSVNKILIGGLFSFIYLLMVARSVPNIFFALVFCFLGGLLYLEILFLLKFYTKQDIMVLETIAKKSPILKKQLTGFVDFLSKFV